MTRFRFPEPDPNMTPLPADFRERVMKDLRTRARKRALVRAAKVAAALLIVTISVYLGIRTVAPAPAPPLHPEIVKQTPPPRPAPPSQEEAVPIPRNAVTSTEPRAEIAQEPPTKLESDIPGIFVLHETRNGKEELVLMVHGNAVRDRKKALALLKNEPCCEVPVQEVRKGKRVTVMIQAGKCRK